MEITGFGASYIKNYQLAASSVSGSQDFASILERTARARNEADQDSKTGVSGSGKTEIDKTDELYQLCLELETFLVKNLLNGMRNTIQKSGLVDDSYAGKMYEDMLYDEYAKDFTKNANFGLAEQAYRQLKHL
jgi:flagellar protein FlgJ